MKIRSASEGAPPKETAKVYTEPTNAATQDMIPDFVNTDDAAAARARLLATAKQATTVEAKPTPQPETINVLEEHRLEVEGSTSITQRVSEREFRARMENNLGEEWVRQDLPSHSVPYNHEEIFLKPFTITVLSRVHAAMKGGNFTQLVDALNQCINIDIRRLTPEDWNAVLYWLRLNSYVRTPYTVPWVSKYGNENEHRIVDSNLEFVELQMTLDEYNEWQNKGLCFPTVRDMELMQDSDIPEEDRWRIQYSQYVRLTAIKKEDGTIDYSDYLNRKLDVLEKGGTAMLEDIRDFMALISHGIVETIEVTDVKFDPLKAVEYLRRSVLETRDMIAAILRTSEDKEIEIGLIGMSKRADDLEAEADLIEQTMKEGKSYSPGKETIELSINAMHFFPTL